MQTTLKTDLYATGIHGVTGQQVDEGTLEVGTLIRNVREHVVCCEDTPIYRFEASTDGGLRWYTQESYSKPDVQ